MRPFAKVVFQTNIPGKETATSSGSAEGRSLITAKPVQHYLDDLVGTLRITGMEGRDPQGAPVFLCSCENCGTSGIRLEYRRIVQGNARCPSSICNRPGQTATAREIPATEIPPDSAAQWAAHEKAAEQERLAVQEQRIADDYRRYVRHAVIQWGIDVGQLPSLDTWQKVSEAARERILRKVESERERSN